MAANISERINTSTQLDSDLIARWNSVISTLANKYVIKTLDITPALAEKYRFDLQGLLSNELNIPNEHIYPHIRINGYDSSDKYAGNQPSLKILDPNILTTYHSLFTK